MKHQVDLEQMMHEHQADVWRYLRMLGCELSRADDLVQDTFVAMIGRSFDVSLGRHATAAYLRNIAYSLYLTCLKRESRQVSLGSLTEAEHTWNSYTSERGDERHDALRRCIDKLDSRNREILELNYKEELSGKEIAKRAATTVNAIKSIMKRTKSQLRECVERSK